MSAVVLGSASLTCLGDGARTYERLLAGECGAGSLRHGDAARLNVKAGYHVGDDDPNTPFRASRWLTRCVREALDDAGVDPAEHRVACVVGTGLRELSVLELCEPGEVPAGRLHFRQAVRRAAPAVTDVLTISNACAAGGHALALGQDLLAEDEVDAVIVAAADAMTESMLAMIGRVTPDPADRVRPFDTDRPGVLLGEGAAALIIARDGAREGITREGARPKARLLDTGLSCDAHHETAPSVVGIARAMRDAYARAGRRSAGTGLVVAHATGTALNDPAECAALREVLLDDGGAPVVTGVKGAVGHTSGVAALTGIDVALRCLDRGRVPPVAGLRDPLPEGADLDLARTAVPLPAGTVQVNAFGFGGVNSVTLLERP